MTIDPASCPLDGQASRRRAYSFRGFVRDVVRSAARLPDLAGAYLPPGRLDPAFREQIMLAVSRMNRCRHCTALHGLWAERAGVDDARRAAIGRLDAAAFTEDEWETFRAAWCLVGDDADRRAAAMDALRRRHGAGQARRIAAVAQMIDLTNGVGNTWDALSDRLHGHAAEGSALADELLVVASVATVGAPALVASMVVRALRGEPAV